MFKKLLLIGLLLSGHVYAATELDCQGADKDGSLVVARFTHDYLRVNDNTHPLSEYNSRHGYISTEIYQDADNESSYLRIYYAGKVGQFIIESVDAKTNKITSKTEFYCIKE